MTLLDMVAHTPPLIPALGKQRKADLCEFEPSLVYIVSTRIGKTT